MVRKRSCLVYGPAPAGRCQADLVHSPRFVPLALVAAPQFAVVPVVVRVVAVAAVVEVVVVQMAVLLVLATEPLVVQQIPRQ